MLEKFFNTILTRKIKTYGKRGKYFKGRSNLPDSPIDVDSEAEKRDRHAFKKEFKRQVGLFSVGNMVAMRLEVNRTQPVKETPLERARRKIRRVGFESRFNKHRFQHRHADCKDSIAHNNCPYS